ncbi:Unknown protein sequence [Pseudomonas syringae pv. maculicola]|nr:Unknown protein sequence [Pseudomonas syringae pv. maculicola]
MVAEQFAAGVVELLRVDGERLGAGDFAVLVQNLVDVFQHQCAWRVDQSVLVVELAVVQVQAQGRIAEQLAALLAQAADAGGQRLAAANAAAAAVGQLRAGQFQSIVTAHATVLAVVEIPGLEGQQAFAADGAALTVVQAGAGQVQRTVGHQLAALVADGASAVEREVCGTGNAASGVGQAAGVQRQNVLTADQALAVIERCRQVDTQGLEGAQCAAGVVQRAADQGQARLA